MPRKGRRIAAKQAQLGQKRKKGRGPSGIPMVPLQNSDGQEPTISGPQATSVTHARGLRPTATSAPSSGTTRRTETGRRPMVDSLVRLEIRRITLLSIVIIAVLVTLSFLLD